MSIQPSAQNPSDASLQQGAVTGHGRTIAARIERASAGLFLWPAVLVILLLSIFPLIISLYLSLSQLKFAKGGLQVNFVGLLNYRKMLFGTGSKDFLGVFDRLTVLDWGLLAVALWLLGTFLLRYLRSGERSVGGLFWRLVFAAGSLGLVAMLLASIGGKGRPGVLSVTLIYVGAGLVFQYMLGLGLAMLASQQLPGRRFFRVVFLLPMMITPVGVAYMFRMLADTSKGPLKPLWQAAGLGDASWVDNPWSARAAVIIGDVWQWTPFMFIVLLAALEAQPVEPIEAALVDGAKPWQIFRYVTWPAILPASATIVLIRMIEAFKIIDLPNVLTNGGPGTATRSMTLDAYFSWRALDVGGSAARAYLLLIVATFICIAYVTFVQRKATEGA